MITIPTRIPSAPRIVVPVLVVPGAPTIGGSVAAGLPATVSIGDALGLAAAAAVTGLGAGRAVA
jgi:hypothetical protein